MFPGMDEGIKALKEFLAQFASEMGRQTELLEDIRHMMTLDMEQRRIMFTELMAQEFSAQSDTSLDQ